MVYLEGKALMGVHKLPYDCRKVTGHIVPVKCILVVILQHCGLAEPNLHSHTLTHQRTPECSGSILQWQITDSWALLAEP